MPGPLFEQYKDALRRGHAALLEGRPGEAAEAYSSAARLVPDRALPHTSLAAALIQLERRDDALAALDRAATIDPDDEHTLRARAAILRGLDRHDDAAADLERLAKVVERAGNRAEALRLARRALELAPTDARRELAWKLEAGEPATPESSLPDDTAEGRSGGGTGPTWPAVDLPSRPSEHRAAAPRDAELLVATAGDRIAAGELAEARDQLLEAVAVHRAAGRPDAALDVCLRLLEIAPGDPAVHLAIANVQLDRGWEAIAADKIRLLLQLTTLTGDTQGAADVHALAAERLHDDIAASIAAG